MLDDSFPIPTQTSDDDKEALLWVQEYVRNRCVATGYVYLEIGSYLGGTIAPHIADPRCRAIYSIDKRVQSQPDNRREHEWPFKDNTTSNMIGNLSKLKNADMAKLTVIESDSQEVDIGQIAMVPNLVFIDAEHTDAAVVKDWLLVEKLFKKQIVCVFHDVQIVTNGIAQIRGRWEELGYIQRQLWDAETISAWHVLE